MKLNKLFVLMTAGPVLYWAGCDISEDISVQEIQYFRLTHLSTSALSVPEPSGLTLSPDGRELWTVSDQTGRVYIMDTLGTVIRDFQVGSEVLDLEGICPDPAGENIWLMHEYACEWLISDREGRILQRMKILEEEGNSGLEGICTDPEDSLIYMVKEKEPGQLLVTDLNGGLKSVSEPDFAPDYSGLCRSSRFNALWVLSDESSSLYLYDPHSGELLDSEPVNMTQPEGIAVDETHGKVYIVSDAQETLQIFRIEFLK